MDDRFDALEDRVAQLEAQVRALTRSAPQQPPLATKPTIQTRTFEPPAPPQVTPVIPERIGAEELFGGRVFLAVGAIALLFGVAFFIKYAFDNGWIGPTGRVVMGMLAGVGCVIGSERLYIKNRRFAEGLTGLGGALLYLSLWAAGNGFHLIPVAVSFVAMAVVTAALVALAVRHESELIAAWALAGGFISPLLSSTETPAWISLFTYLAILDAALVLLPATRRWPRIGLATFFFTELYLFFAYVAGPPSDPAFLGFSTLFLALFTWQPIAKSLRQIKLDGIESLLVVANAVAYYFSLHVKLYDRHRLYLTAAVVILAAAYLVLANVAKPARALFAAIALALITGGIAITFSGHAITSLWAIEGAALVFIGLRSRLTIVRVFALIAFAFSLLTLLADFPSGGRAFDNDRFFVLTIVAASFLAARFAFARFPADIGSSESTMYLAAEALGNAALLAAIANELYTLTRHSQLSLTIFTLLFGAVLLALGVFRHRLFTRVEGFVAISLAVLKAFFVDLSAVDPAVRIISFLVLGFVLLGISYAYLRSKRSATELNG